MDLTDRWKRGSSCLAGDRSGSTLSGKSLERAEVLAEVRSDPDHGFTGHVEGRGDLEDGVVLACRDRLVRRSDCIETAKETESLFRLAHVTKGSSHEMVVAGAIGPGRLDRGLAEELRPIGIELAEAFEVPDHLQALAVLGSEVGAGDPSEEIGEGGRKAGLFGREALEAGADLSQARGLRARSLRSAAE